MKSRISEDSKIEYLSKLLNRVFCVLSLYEEKESEKSSYKRKSKEVNLIKHTRRLYDEFEDSSWLLEPLFGGQYIEMINKVRRLQFKVRNNFVHHDVRSLVLDTTNIIGRKLNEIKEGR